MASRMDRYYEEENTENLRTRKNKNLYQSIYNDAEYTNIEGITSISRSGRIDVEEIKKLLNQKEEKKEEIKPKETISPSEEKLEEDRVYDIRDILNKAKDEHPSKDKYHSLKNQDYDFLKNIDIKKEEENVDKELDELVNTLTNADLFSNVKDEELSLDLLSELKPSEETKVSDNLKKLIQEESKNYHNTEKKDLDQTFFTSEQNFSKEDFDDDDDDEFYQKKSHKWIFILILVVMILILTLVYFLVIKK